MRNNLIVNVLFYADEDSRANDDIHRLCKELTEKTDISEFTFCLDVINVTIIISSPEMIGRRRRTQNVMISRNYRTANITLRINEEEYFSLRIAEKKKYILDFVLSSMMCIKRKLKEDFDYSGIENHLLKIWYGSLV